MSPVASAILDLLSTGNVIPFTSAAPVIDA
jgi:hypothetical protein